MEAKWLSKALRNLEFEAEYLSRENRGVAIKMVKRVHDAVVLLEENPSLGRPGRVIGTREVVVSKTPYIIPYQVRNNRVELLRLFHTSRRLPKGW